MIRVGGKIVVNKITLLLKYHGTVIVFINTSILPIFYSIIMYLIRVGGNKLFKRRMVA